MFFTICLTFAYRCNVDDLMIAVGKSYITLTLGDLFYVSNSKVCVKTRVCRK